MLTQPQVQRFAMESGLRDIMIAEKEVVLTFLLQLLSERGLLDRVAFKGGTCLRKMIVGSQGRFSTDLDFTGLEEHDHQDVILDMMAAFEQPFHGIQFAIHMDDFYETQDTLSWGVNPTYAHDWNESGVSEVKLQISRRETPTLPTELMRQQEQSYFKFLPFAPAEIRCLALNEILAEKIRACYQRNKARDIYDLGMFATRPLDQALIRRMVVIKLWPARDSFDPAALVKKFEDGRDFDWDDLRQLTRRSGHHFAPDMAHAAADAVKAGTDLECGFGNGQAFPDLVDAVHQNLITEAELDTSLRRLFRARFRLGMFDPPSSFAYGRIPYSEVNSPEHRELSLQAARESMVLLKNTDGILPLKSGIRSIAVIGPTAELVQSLQGNYNGPPQAPVLPLEGVEKRFSSARVMYAQGSSLVEGLAMPIEHTALHPASGPGEGLTGEYFDSKDLTGKPVLTRTDRTINFNWDKFAPIGGLERNNYSVRWSGTFTPPASGDYKLGVHVNYCYACENAEGFRLYLDGKLLVESSNQKTGERGAVIENAIHFSDSKPHAIRLEYFHGTGSAGIDLTWQAPAAALLDQAVAAAKQSDITVAFVGLSPSLEGEEMPVKLDGFSSGDRTSINLPAVQEEMLKAVAATGKPLIVVLQNGSALAVNWAQEHANAILEAWYPGEEGGTAIAETLAGDNNPGGRLPLTFYASLDQVPPFVDYSMKGRTYRYFSGKPLYPFGFGLSYTSFAYRDLKVPSSNIKAGDPVQVEGELKNTGSVAGDEVVELYLTQPRDFETPLHMLAGFTRVHLAPGQSTHVAFTLDPRTLGQVDEKGERVVLPGVYEVSLGGGQPNEMLHAQSARFTVVGSAKLPE